MNIGDAAGRAGLPAKTIRYYEDIGLVTPHRAANGYRRFTEADLHKLTFLGRARLLALYADDGRASADVKRIAQGHLDRIDRKIAELSAMRETLSHLVQACAGDQKPDCPILRGLENG